MKYKFSQVTKKSVSLLLAILMMFSMLTIGITTTSAYSNMYLCGKILGEDKWKSTDNPMILNGNTWSITLDLQNGDEIKARPTTGDDWTVSYGDGTDNNGNYKITSTGNYTISIADGANNGTKLTVVENATTPTTHDFYFEQYYQRTGEDPKSHYEIMNYDSDSKTYSYTVNFADHPWQGNYRFGIVTEHGAGRSDENKSVTAYKKKTKNQDDMNYVTIVDSTGNLTRVDRSEHYDVHLTFDKTDADTDLTYTVTYEPGESDILDGTITITKVTSATTPSITLSAVSNNLVYTGTPVSTALTATPKNFETDPASYEYTVKKDGAATTDAEVTGTSTTATFTAKATGTYKVTATAEGVTSNEVTITVSDPTLATPKIKGESFVVPNGTVKFALDNQKDFGTPETDANGETGNYIPYTGLTLNFEVTASDGSTPTVTTSKSGKLVGIDDTVEITAGNTEGVTYTVKVTANMGTGNTQATATTTVSYISEKLSNRIYAYAAPLANGATPTAYNAWSVSETNDAPKKVYREYSNGSYSDEKIPSLGAPTDTNIRIFLPTTANSSKVVLYNTFGTKITVNGTDIESGKYATVSYTPNTEMTVTFADGNTADKKLTIYKSSAQGALYLNHTGAYKGVDGNNVLKMLAQLYRGKEEGAIGANNAGAVADKSGKLANVTVKKIKGRGNSTWKSTDKKSFNVNFNENLGGKYINSTFKGKKYSLLANFKDPSLSRNKILYALGDYMGAKYSPDVATIDLYMNGMYMGNYLMTQKVDIGSKELVKDLDSKTLIEEQYGDFATALKNPGEVANGFSFMMELDTNAGKGDFHFDVDYSEFKQTLTIKEPEYLKDDGYMYEDALTSTIQTFIEGRYKALIDALKGTDATALNNIIDVPSLARFMMLNELAKNYDIGVSSTYFVYDKAKNKFFISPVWDLDVTTGNCKESESGYQSYEDDWTSSNNSLNKVMRLVFANETVKNEVKSFWTEDYYEALCKEIDRLTSNAKTDAKGSFECNYVKWSYPDGFQGEHSDDVQFKTSLTTANYFGGAYNNNASTETYQNNSYSQTEFVGDWLKSRAAWLTSKYNTPVTSEWRIEYYTTDHQYIKPVAVDNVTGTVTWKTHFNFGNFLTDGKFRITKGEPESSAWNDGGDKNFCVPSYKRGIQKGTETYVTVKAKGLSVETGKFDGGSFGVSQHGDIKIKGTVDPTKTYIVTYTPGKPNELDGQITISDAGAYPNVTLKGTEFTDKTTIDEGVPVTLTATIKPAEINNSVVTGEYTVDLYRNNVKIETRKITFTNGTSQTVEFTKNLASKNDTYRVEASVTVDSETFTGVSDSLNYKQAGLKNNKIYVDPSVFSDWKSKFTKDSTITATVDGTSFTMVIDPDDPHALDKGVFRGMVDDETLIKLQNPDNTITFALDGTSLSNNEAKGNASVQNGYIFTYDKDSDGNNRFLWANYNDPNYVEEYPGGCQTYQEFEQYLAGQLVKNTDNIVYFDNSASEWYNVYIYDWNSEEGKNAVQMKKLPYANIWYYDFGDTMHNTQFLFKDRSGLNYGIDYQQTVDLVDGKVKNGNGDDVAVRFESTINTPNPIFVTANFYKCTINQTDANSDKTLKFRAFNTEWKEFYSVATSAVRTKAIDVYFDMHSSTAADIPLYHSTKDIDKDGNPDFDYTFASTFTRLTKLPGSNIYHAKITLPYTTQDGITTAFYFDKFMVGTKEYKMSDAVQPLKNCITTGEVWYEFDATGKDYSATSTLSSGVKTSSANKSRISSGANNTITVYFAPENSSNKWENTSKDFSGRTYKCHVQGGSLDNSSWWYVDMVDTGKTIGNNKVYSATISYSDVGLYNMQFQKHYNNSFENQVVAFCDSWKETNTMSGKFWDGNNWVDPKWDEYYVAGAKYNNDGKQDGKGIFGAEWKANDENDKMKLTADNTYTKVYTNVPQGNYEFKITDGTWDHSWPDKNKQFEVKKNGATVTITFDSSSNKAVKVVVTELTPSISLSAASTTLYKPQDGNATTKLTPTVENATDYTVSYTVNDQDTSFTDNTFTASEAGTYIVKASITVDGNTYTSNEVTITVKAPSITITPVEELTISDGEASATLDANLNADAESANVTYSLEPSDVEGASISGNTFTATEAGTYTVKASITVGGNTYTDTTNIVVNAQIPDVYRVVGNAGLCGSEWNHKGNDNIMSYNEATGKYQIVFDNIAKGEYEYKVQKNGITDYPGYNAKVTVQNDNSSVLVTFDPNNNYVDKTVYSVTLNNTALTLALNATSTLTATPEGFNGNGTWTTDNSAIATVNNGIVTAVGVGTTNITVTYTENGVVKTATCAVTVKNYSVTLDKSTLTLDINGTKTGKLTATTEGFTVSGTWTSDKESVATVDKNGNVTALAKGTATITVTYTENGVTKSATCTVTVNETTATIIDHCGILGYNHVTATFDATNGGTINKACVTLKNGYYQDAAYETGYKTTDGDVITVIYALVTEKTGATTTFDSTTSHENEGTGEGKYTFNGWDKNGTVFEQKTVSKTLTDGVSTTAIVNYVANWSKVPVYTYTFTYNYYDYNVENNGIEYIAKGDDVPDSVYYTKKTYTVKVNSTIESTDTDAVKALYLKYAPRLESDYFNYSFDGVTVTVDKTGFTATGKASSGVKKYSVFVQDAESGTVSKTKEFFYQNIVELTHKAGSGKYTVWKNEKGAILGYGNTYKFRVTKNNITIYYDEVDSKTATERTIVNAPTYEFYTSEDTQRVRFNFLVDNYVDDPETVEEYGVLYFFTDSIGKPVDTTIAQDENITEVLLKSAVNGGVTGIRKFDATTLAKKNNYQKYIFAPTLSYTTANTDRYLRVFSYFKKKDGTIIVSDEKSCILGSIREAIS